MPDAQPSSDAQARQAGLPPPDRWDFAGPHPQEPTWHVPLLRTITVLHDNHDVVLIDGRWELVSPEQLDELADKLRAAARWLRRPADEA